MMEKRKCNYRFLLPVLFAAFLLSVQTNAQAQGNAGDRRVTLDLQDVSLQDFFGEIRRQTGLSFVYNADQISPVRISVKASNEPLEGVLSRTLAGGGLTYRIEGGIITIQPAQSSRTAPGRQRIGGTVTDTNGRPLVGVTIWLIGTSTGTATDPNGHYSLEFAADVQNPVFQFSMIGMESQNIPFRGQGNISITMEESQNVLDEIQVIPTGMFTRNVQTFTGATTHFKKEELKRVGNTNVLASLANLDPSFNITESVEFGSDPNRMPDISIRGQSSLQEIRGETQSDLNQPLYILNGFEATVQKIYDLDMELVESITLLKDAAAKAIYGSKAANGVVVIETVKPESGKLRVSYNGSLNITAPDLTTYNLTNSAEKLQAEVLSGKYTSSNAVTQSELTYTYNELLKEVERGVDTYWLSKPLRTGVGHKHTVYMDGGDDAMQYSANLSYNNVAGVMKGSSRTNVSGGVTLSYRYKNLIFRNELTVDGNTSINSKYGSFTQYSQMNPYWRTEDENGSLIRQYSQQSGYQPNPLFNATLNSKDRSEYTNVTENFYGEWNIRTDLKAIFRLGYNQQRSETVYFKPGNHSDYDNVPTTSAEYANRGYYRQGQGKSRNLSADAGLAYTIIANKHLLYLNGMYTVSAGKAETVSVTAEGFPSDRMDFITLGDHYQTGGKPSGSESSTRDVGFVVSGNYSFDNRYLFDFSYRLTGSSQFGADNRWGHFWSVGAGWNLHKEKFMAGATFLDLLKLRASIGYTGSQNFSSYQAIMTYSYITSKNYDGDLGALLMALANPELKWQQQLDRNIGFDLGLFKKLGMNFNYYSSVTNDLLADITLAPSAGFATYKENLGKTENKGFEIAFNYNLYSKAETRTHANLFFNIAHNKNKVVEISNSLKRMIEEQDDDQSTYTSNVIRYEEGQSMTAIWAVKSMGIDPASGKEVFVKKDGTTTYDWSAADRVVCGDLTPKVRGNVGANVSHKGFELNLSFSYRIGGQIYNQTLADKVENAVITNYNIDKRVLTERWTTPGQKAKYKAITDRSTTNATSRFVQDYNEFLLSSINLGYDFSQLGFVKKSPLSYLKATVQMSDVARFTSVKYEQGLDYPRAHVFSLAISARF